jgi:hypothetical protein
VAQDAFRREFEEALRLFARASEAMISRELPAPVLVGGAAVEIYSMGAINTGDLDIVTPWQAEFEEELRHRLGQYASGTAPEMLEQARRLFALHRDADREYMEKRIRQESLGDYGVEDLEN